MEPLTKWDKAGLVFIGAVLVILLYGVVTDCKNIVGYHKDTGGGSCKVM